MQHIDMLGNIIWEPNGVIISDTMSAGGIVSLVSSASNEIICIWLDSQNQRLTGQRLDNNCNTHWSVENVSISYNIYGCSNLNTVNDRSGGAILCWYVYPAILYVQQISTNGNLGEVLSVKQEPYRKIPGKIMLLPNYPNPFNNQINLTWTTNIGGAIRLNITNLLGQRVSVSGTSC